MDEDNVLYCPNCLSLQIIGIEGTDICYCGKCGHTNIAECSFDEWDKMYKKKYGKKYLTTGRKYII